MSTIFSLRETNAFQGVLFVTPTHFATNAQDVGDDLFGTV